MRRAPKPQTLMVLHRLERLGIFTVEDSTRLGISQPTLSRLVARGVIRRVGRGFYTHRYSRLELRYQDFAIACRKFGYRTAIGGPSALYFHGLLPKSPKEVWVLVGHNQKTVSPKYRCLRANRKPLTGIIDRQYFRVTNLDRTLVECLRHAGKVGRDFAREAVRRAIRNRATTAARLFEMRSTLDLPRAVRDEITQLVAIAASK